LTTLISRRAIFRGLMAGLLGTRHVHAQSPGRRSLGEGGRVRSKPRPLAKDAVTHDWTAFLGPTHNAVSTETKLSRRLPPPLIWEFTRGSGYASPAIAGARLVYLHRVGGEELVECLHPETGGSQWRFRYPTDYEDRYGYNDGPRSSPVVDASRVFTVGAQGQLHCLELETGTVIWKRDLRKDYRVSQDFFGTASTPLVEGQLLIERRRAGRSVRGVISVRTRGWRAARTGAELRRRFRRRPRQGGAVCSPAANRVRRAAD
jgi:hypothetical protein